MTAPPRGVLSAEPQAVQEVSVAGRVYSGEVGEESAAVAHLGKEAVP